MSASRLNPQNVPTLKARKSPRTPGGPFADLTWPQQRVAEQWLWKWCLKWGNDLPPWRRAILIGTAKRLAKNPPKYHFGHSLHLSRCGKATAKKYRDLGVPHATAAIARAALAWKRAGKPSLTTGQLPV